MCQSGGRDQKTTLVSFLGVFHLLFADGFLLTENLIKLARLAGHEFVSATNFTAVSATILGFFGGIWGLNSCLKLSRQRLY